jgi:signal transduction histidine kinase
MHLQYTPEFEQSAKRSEVEEARAAGRRELEAELRESRRAQRALLEADRRKDAFLATLSHELRGPLSPIANALEVMNRHPEDPAVSSWARELMQRQVSQLSHLIDDLLDLNRITQGKIKLRTQSVLLLSIIDQAIEACRPLLDAKEHKLMLALPPGNVRVQADPVRLTQVFVNLVHNACKFTAPRGDIRVTGELDGAEVAIRVRDSGIGIPPDALDSIFEMFTQETSSTGQEYSGLGIGLYLVKRLVELHGGTVTASSAGLGHGSEFLVRLAAITEGPDN